MVETATFMTVDWARGHLMPDPRTRRGQGVKDLPNMLSRSSRNRVPELESTYRNQMVKHEPKPHTS
jgi:hypothetical protein